MAIRKIFIVIVLISNLVYSQNLKKDEISNDKIVFGFKEKNYIKIALDSIKTLYKRQFDYYTNGNAYQWAYDKSISLNYKFEDLTFTSIPVFRLYRDANKLFDCNSKIENFIVFEEFNKYQEVFVKVKDKEDVLCVLSIPNEIFELDRTINPNLVINTMKQDVDKNYY